MPRNYQRKHGRKDSRPYQCSYDPSDLEKALKAIEGGMSAYKASKEFKVPKSTLYDKQAGNEIFNKIILKNT